MSATVIELDVNPQRRTYTRARSRAGKRHRRFQGTNRDRGSGKLKCVVCALPLATHDRACFAPEEYVGRRGGRAGMARVEVDEWIASV